MEANSAPVSAGSALGGQVLARREDQVVAGDPLPDDRPLVDHPEAFHQHRLGAHRLQVVGVVMDGALLELVGPALPGEEPVERLAELQLRHPPVLVLGEDALGDEAVAQALQRALLRLERQLELGLGDQLRRHQQVAEEVALLLGGALGGDDGPVDEAHLHLLVLAPEVQDARLLLLGDELEDVGDAEVLERAGQGHRLAPLLRQVAERGAPGRREQQQRQHQPEQRSRGGPRRAEQPLAVDGHADGEGEHEGVQRTAHRNPGEEVPGARPEQPEPVRPAAHPRLVVADLHLLVHPGHRRHLAATGVDVDALVTEVAVLHQLRVAAAAHRPAALAAAPADPLAHPGRIRGRRARPRPPAAPAAPRRARGSPPGSGRAARSPGTGARARR